MGSSIERIEPGPTLRERVHQSLERLIIDGDLAPGQHLIETELAGQLGVSRGPVREALQTLSRDGWVELRPRYGAFVRQPSENEVSEFFQVRALLEAECARLAALKVTPSAEARFRRLVADGWAAVAHGDERELVAANAALHGYVTELAGNGTLQELTQRLRKRSQWYFTPVSLARSQAAWTEHEAVVEAIVAGDPELAAQNLRAHIHATQRTYSSLVVSPGPGVVEPVATSTGPVSQGSAAGSREPESVEVSPVSGA